MPSLRRLKELAEVAGAKLVGDGAVEIERVSAVNEAGPGSLTFAVDERWLNTALKSRASAVIAPPFAADAARGDKTLLIVDNVRAALAAILASFAPPLPEGEFTHATAVLEPDVRRGKDVWIGPGVIVGEGAELGDRVVLMAGSYVGRCARIGTATLFHPRASVLDDCVIGERCILHAGCVIGSDGFGFVRVGEEQIKIPQIGNVVIGDDVEIGACTTVDRAVTGSTTIGSGTKIDNLVQVAHNVQIGEHSTLCGQVGIAGSTKIGRAVTAAGQVGIGGHIEVGDHSLLLGQAGVSHSLGPHSRVSGTPAQSHRDEMEQKVLLRRLPKLAEEIRALAEAVERLSKRR